MEWILIDVVNILINLIKLGVFEYKSELLDYIILIENYFKCIENEEFYKKIGKIFVWFNVIYSKFVLYVIVRYLFDFLFFFRIKERSRGVCMEKYCLRLVNDYIDDDFLYILYVYIIFFLYFIF